MCWKPTLGLTHGSGGCKNIPFLDLDYCQFCEWGYKKPTRFWACKLISDLPPGLCDPLACPNVHRKWDGTRKHFPLLGWTTQRFSPTMKARIPPDVVNYLLQTGVSEGQKNRCRRRWKQVTPPERNVVCMQLEQRFFHEIPSYQLNKVRTGGDDLQLLMKWILSLNQFDWLVSKALT